MHIVVLAFVENLYEMLFGSVRRMQWTFGVIGLLYLAAHPALVAALMDVALRLAITVIAFIFFIRVFTGKKGPPPKKP